MKSFTFLVTLLGLFCGAAPGQEAKTNPPVRIQAADAKANIGTNAIVTGKIVDVHFSEKVVSLNFEKPFPKQLFTAVIFATKTNLFPALDKLKDKTVEVSGKIVEYRDRPEIIVNSTNQLKVVEKDAEPEKK
jgi:DNA/RNA endonuclease YhcR with UshA esterase domain